MKVALKVIAGVVVVFALLLGLMDLYIQDMPEVKEVADFNEKFNLVQIGDPEAKTISVLGSPDAKEKEFRLGQKKGFEDAYARAEASDSAYYLFWFRGIDVVLQLVSTRTVRSVPRNQAALNNWLVRTPGTAREFPGTMVAAHSR